MAPDEATSVGAPATPAGPTRPDVGFGERSDRKLPDLPPAPHQRPFEHLNPTQIVLRTVMVLALGYILLVIGQTALTIAKDRVCAMNPYAPQCMPRE